MGHHQRRRLYLVALIPLVAAVGLAGCAERLPLLGAAERAVFTDNASGNSRAATPAELEQLVVGYQEARRVSDDGGTTHPIRVEITLSEGRSITLLGGNPGRLEWQTVVSDGRQFNIEGQRLHDLLSRVAVELGPAP